MLFLTDPWNPTGKNIPRDFLEEMLYRAGEIGCAVLLDQSFLPLSEGTAPPAPELLRRFPHLVIVRSYTKIFSLPGLRMGCALSSAEMIRRIRRQLPEWNLSSAAGCAMEACARLAGRAPDKIFDREEAAKERAYLTGALTALGCRVYKSDTVFLLFRSVPELYSRLLEQRILIRDCSDFPGLGKGYFRIAVKDHFSNEKLIKHIGGAV